MDKNVNEQFIQITREGKITGERPVSKQRAGKQCLTDKKIIELAKICQKIERHYGFSCDIEWALGKGKLYIEMVTKLFLLQFLSFGCDFVRHRKMSFTVAMLRFQAILLVFLDSLKRQKFRHEIVL